MRNWRSVRSTSAFTALLLTITPTAASAATIHVPEGGNLQAAIDAARPGDTITLAAGATYTGNFRLPIHGGTADKDYVTIRTAPSSHLPPDGTRVSPAHAPYLATIKSPNTESAMRTLASAAYWRLLLLKFDANVKGYNDLVQFGDGSSKQNDLSLVPHHLIADRLYMQGDPVHGQKRGIGINAAHITVINSHIVGMKAVGQDAQAIAGWNGPGPFRIENNYLEATGEVFMMGGDDPKIAGMTPTGLTFRGNTLSRPLSWRDPVIAMAERVRVSAEPNGTLGAGTYAYRVTARTKVSSETANSPASAEVAVTMAAGSRALVQWDPVAGATDYVVHGRTAGAQSVFWVVTSTSFTDDGTKPGTATKPKATVWEVKNIFELKHMRDATIAYNVMENNWAAGQDGTAILFTPRNQGGRCPWCVVEDITFEYNVVRHVGSGLTVLGWDNEKPSQQARNIVVRNNLFYDVSKSWGGTGYVFRIFDGPFNVEIDHNTAISPSGSGFMSISGRPAEQFTLTNNVARHNSYGIHGNGKGIGLAAIAYYFPGGDVRRNVLAGGSAKYYPTDYLFPTLAGFEAHFTNYAANDFTLIPGTDWDNAGTDGKDLGADMAAIERPQPLGVTTASLDSTTELLPYSETLEATGGRTPYTWTLADGTLPDGLWLDPHSGTITGSATVDGDYQFTVQVEDAIAATAVQPLSIRVARAVPPVRILTGTIAPAIETMSYSQVLAATGGSGWYSWSVTAGALPPGLSLSTDGVISGTPAVTMTGPHASATSKRYDVTLTVADPADTSRTEQHAYSLIVWPPPPKAPSVSITAPEAHSVFPVGATVTVAAAGVDVDGTVQRVDFFVNGVGIGSGTAPHFSTTWVVRTAGAYSFSAVATDDEGFASSTSDGVTISTKSEIVLRASQVKTMKGNFTLSPDYTAAGGQSLWLLNKSLAKVGTAVAAPAHYAEFTFYAEAGRPYRLWMRGRAEGNSYSNDSVHVQFSGVPTALIGTTGSMVVNLEDDANAGIAGWGWQDNGWGTAVLGPPIVFGETGLQTMRIQNREDGLMIDQIVLSPEQFLTTSPGALKEDTTTLPQ
jgi:hypothetical protein